MTRSSPLAKATALCFFLSGAPALIDQVVWMKAFSRLFGSSTHAIATVLSAFMVGLSLGSYLAARRVARLRRPLYAYAALEMGIALYAAISLQLIDAVGSTADAWLATDGVPALARTGGLFAVSFFLLLLPTTLMGATLPVLASLARAEIGLSLPLLYGANTLGAAAGSLLSGFVLIPEVGFQRTLLVSAACNVTVAGIAVMLTRGLHVAISGDSEAPVGIAGGLAARRALLAFLAVSGAATMSYEIVFSRLAALSFGGSIYSFALVVAAFLCGIGIGGVGYHHARASGPIAESLPLWVALSGLLVLLTGQVAGRLPLFSFYAHRAFAHSFFALEASVFATLFLLLCAPAAVLGVTFPAALECLAGTVGGLGRGAGLGSAVNTIGAAVGAVVAGFWLLPAIGLSRLLQLSAVAPILAALGLHLSLGGRAGRGRALLGTVGAALAVAALAPPWSQKELAEGVFRAYHGYQSVTELREHIEQIAMLFYQDGPSATVAVFQMGPDRSLRINGKPDASTNIADLQTQYLSGHIPALLFGDPRSALIIGLGSGATAHALSLYPRMERLDVAELEPAVVTAARGYFGAINGDVFSRPALRVHVEDGRRFVRRATRRYDVIVSEPSNVWVAGVADLYSREHLLRVRAALSDDGVFAQWIHGYHLSPRWVHAVLRTVADVFPDVSLWFTTPADYLVVARNRAKPLDLSAVRGRFTETPAIGGDLARCGLNGPRSLCARYLLDDREARAFVGDGVVLRDDLPLVEYLAPRDVSSLGVLRLDFGALMQRAVPCPLANESTDAGSAAREWLGLAETAVASRRGNLARSAFAAAERARPSATGSARHAAWLLGIGAREEARSVVLRGLERFPDDLRLSDLAAELAVARPAPQMGPHR